MTAAAPTGHVTLVFTDVAGSTPLWEHAPADMREGLQVHDATLRRLIQAHGGYEVKTEGDAFMVAFSEPAAAVRWCIAVQDELLRATWPPGLLAQPDASEVVDADGVLLFRGLRVRAGLHLGHPDCRSDPTSGRMDYFGPMVNRAARVSGAAHGGQVLATREAWLAAMGGARGITAEDLGSHQLKGLGEAIPLVQICPGSHRRRFPPPKSAGRATNLRPSRTRFIGRSAELEACCARLEAGARILTLLGPGGCGKTRLSRSLAARQMEALPGGAWFVELAEATDLGDIVAAVATVLSVPLATGTPAEHVRQLERALAARDPLVLVLDNVEQVIDAAAEAVGRWVECAPGLRVVATSRQRLHVAGEVFVELGPLSDADALALFVDRAEEAAPGFARTDERILAVTRCLDNIPLAIELAAARVSLLPLPALHKRLKESVKLLRNLHKDAVERQSTMFATIEWSWRLLGPWEQAALVQCTVFRGGFDLDAAEAVISVANYPGAPEVLDVIQALRDRSLLRAWQPGDGDVRFGLLESIREFVTEKSQPSATPGTTALPPRGGARDRHLAWFSGWLTETVDAARREGSRALLEQAAREEDNALTALDWALETGHPAAFPLARSIDALLRARIGHATDAWERALGDRLERLIRAVDALGQADQSAAVRVFAAEGTRSGVSLQQVRELLDEALELVVPGSVAELAVQVARLGTFGIDRAPVIALGDELAASVATLDGDVQLRFHLALCRWGDPGRALAEARTAVAIARELGDSWSEIRALTALGSALLATADGSGAAIQAAAGAFTDAQAQSVAAGVRSFEGVNVGNLGGVAFTANRLADAEAAFQDALGRARQVGDPLATRQWCRMLGVTAHARGDLDAATRYLVDALRVPTWHNRPLAEIALAEVRIELALPQLLVGDRSSLDARVPSVLREHAGLYPAAAAWQLLIDGMTGDADEPALEAALAQGLAGGDLDRGHAHGMRGLLAAARGPAGPLQHLALLDALPATGGTRAVRRMLARAVARYAGG